MIRLAWNGRYAGTGKMRTLILRTLGLQTKKERMKHGVILHFSTFYSTAAVGRLGFMVGVSASYSYFGLSLNKRERLSPRY